MSVIVNLNDEQAHYLGACARIRGIHVSSLFKRLVSAISKDQLVGAILDDADEMTGPRNGEHSYREVRPD